MSRRGPERGPTVRQHVLFLALAALLPVWGLAGHIAGRMAEAERARISAQARETAQELAFAVERETLSMRAELTALGTTMALNDGDLSALYAQMRALPPERGARLRLTDAVGHVLLDTALPFPPPEGQVLPPASPARGGGLSALILPEQPDGPFRVDVTQEIPQPPGDPSLFLTASTDPRRLWVRLLERAELPGGWVGVLVDGHGRQVARRPARPETTGMPLPEGGILLQALREPATRGWGRGIARTGEPVYTAWQRVGGTTWIIAVSMPAEALDGALPRALMPVLVGGLVLLLGFTIGLAWWAEHRIAAPLDRLGRMAQAFGRDAPLPGFPPSGLREIDTAAATLTAAAAERDALRAERMALTARLQMVLESTTDSVLVLDDAGRVIYLNGRARALAGGRDAAGQPLAELFPGLQEGPFGAAARQALAQGVAQSVTAFHAAFGRWISADAYPSTEGLTLFFRDVSDERAAQAALRESEARLKAVMENVPVGVLLAEAPSGRILLGNRRMEDLLRRPIRFSGRIEDYAAEWEAYHADGQRVSSEEFPLSRALLTGLPAQGEYRFRRGDGSMVWLQIEATPVRDAAGLVTGGVVAASDIDAERRAAEALRESELRFRILAEAIPQVVWSSLPDGRIDYVNPRVEDFTGLPPDQAVLSLGQILHPADQARAERGWRRALRRGRPFAAELRLRRADGGWRWCVVRALPAQGPDGAISRWIGAVTDVSELAEARDALSRQVAAQAASRAAAVQAAAALAASESRFRRFAEASPDVMWMTDPSGRHLEFLSPAFERIWGIPRERLLESPEIWMDTIHPADRDPVKASWANSARDGLFDAEYRILRPDGSMRWIRDVSFPMLDAQGIMVRRGGLSRDITAAKAAEARQALLLGELNHRVKNTLATVHSLALQTARTAGNAPDSMQRFLADYQSRLLTLSRGHDLLTARTWRGATINDIARAALAPWQSQDGPDGAARLSLSGPDYWLAPRQALGLALAMHELATNATKHGALSCPGGRVVVAWVGEAEGMVRLRWREEGGPPARPPTRRGFGSRMLERGLPAELGPGSSVEMEYAEEGFRAAIRFRPANGPQVEEETA
ncbi:PAS domain S-box protein [Roseomonas sp. GC11]|uniref:PAS domain S-box protein n=1 Tax=Roseomonas sp. GC11 TaxID=2950546 RepID=UPI00210E33D7|nr:PAS domain S-box protein [Roseomonas sp. GC11]MCQ4161028.1 PAS domain S-box protein [Roseomonas sp. GC11]